ncbi:hypothetical protein ACJ41O_000319 [Fusarium nematophilum]
MEVRVVQKQDKMESLKAQDRLRLAKTGPDVAPEPTPMARLGARQLLGRQQENGVDGSDFPECWTGIKTAGNSEITAYVCANVFWMFSMVESTETEVTTTGTDDEGELTTIVVTRSVSVTGVTGAGIAETEEPTSTPSSESSTSSLAASATSEAANSGGRSEIPVGAIVGGVIGSVALIVFIAFALWYVRFHKKTAAAGSNGAQGGTGGPQHAAHGYEPMAMQQPTPGPESVSFQSQTLSPASPDNHSPNPLGSPALNSSPGQNFVVVAAADQSIPNAVKPDSPLLPYELPPNSPVRG